MRSLARPPRTPALIPFVRRLGYSEDAVPHRHEMILPGGGQDLMINLYDDRFWAYEKTNAHGVPIGSEISGIGFGGASHQPTVADTGDMRTILSINFTFGGAYPFFGAQAAETAGRLVDAGALWGRAAHEFRERLLESPTPDSRLDLAEALLADRLLNSTAGREWEPDPAIGYAVKALEHGSAVRTVVDDLGWTPKRFVRDFTEQLGLPPKRFARVRRLQRVLTSIEGVQDPDWARVACEHGFFDQAHFVNDFKSLTGLTPTAYVPRGPGEHNHVPLTG
ncbi:helix-turn-helix domain-containing protein [Flindersiella endophytica]